MLYQLSGYPEEDDLVLCKVTKIFPNSVFVELLEYDKQGMVHISEIAAGRIRNLRDYVSPGREIVCKVLRVDPARGHIDLSLRRVNSHQRQEKLNHLKQELKAENLLTNIAKKRAIRVEELYMMVTEKVLKLYPYLYLCFKDVAADQAQLEKIGVEPALAKEITAAVLEKFKPEKIFLHSEIRIQTYLSNGIQKIKDTLQKIGHIPGSTITYLGAGRYKLVLEDVDYKPAEKNMAKVEEILQHFNDKVSVASLKR